VAVAEVEGRPVVVLASSEGTVGVWDLASGELHHQLGGHSDEVTAVTVAEVEGRPVVVSASDDKTVGVWDLASGELRHRLTGHSGPVTAVAVAGVEGRPVVVSASFDKTVRVWTGMQSWICEQTNMFGAMITSSVITPPGIIILGSSDGLLLTLSKRPSATTRR
jgi:WD40 repeat protein